jgi:hypothetical protein
MRMVMPDLIAPKLKSLSFYNVDILFGLHSKLLRMLEERCTYDASLESLVLHSCRVSTLECKEELESLVEKVIWENVMEMRSNYGSGILEDIEWDSESEDEDYDFGMHYYL